VVFCVKCAEPEDIFAIGAIGKPFVLLEYSEIKVNLSQRGAHVKLTARARVSKYFGDVKIKQ
jgi:hypothetical protein